MTQKAQLQKYKDKDKPDVGPSTPVVITGGGGGGTEEVDGVPRISFVSPADQPSSLVFHTNPPEKLFWRQSTSGTPILISKVVAGVTTVVIEPAQHPVTITFEQDGGPSFNIIEMAGEGLKYHVLLNGISAGQFETTQASGDGWVGATSDALNGYNRVIVVGQTITLTDGFTVELHFDE